MKRFFLVCGLVIALLLSGCGSSASRVETLKKYSLQGTTQGNGLTGGVPPVRFSM